MKNVVFGSGPPLALCQQPDAKKTVRSPLAQHSLQQGRLLRKAIKNLSRLAGVWKAWSDGVLGSTLSLCLSPQLSLSLSGSAYSFHSTSSLGRGFHAWPVSARCILRT